MIFIYIFTLFFNTVQSDDLLDLIQEKYENSNTLKISFKQTTHFKLTDISSETKGEFWFKKEHAYKFETQERLLLADGVDSWELNKVSNQVIINDYKESSSSPKDFLFSYKKNYHSEHLSEKDDIHSIKLFPKEGVRTSDEYLIIWIDEENEIVKKIEQYKLNGNIVIFDIENIEFDEKIMDSEFKFKVDEAKHHVVDMRF